MDAQYNGFTDVDFSYLESITTPFFPSKEGNLSVKTTQVLRSVDWVR